MDPSIFRSYDIRGRIDTGEIDAKTFRRIGEVFSNHVDGATVSVGRDVRPSSTEFADALIEGVAAAGSDVVDLGEVPTEVVTFASGSTGTAGAMITASHNPPEYNGVKLTAPDAVPISSENGLADIGRRALSDWKAPTPARRGAAESIDPIDDFLDLLHGACGDIPALRVVIDGGNGMAGTVVPRLVERTDLDVVPLYLEPDGLVPNHPADPLKLENLADIRRVTVESGADFGAAFDGDADRIFFIDEGGAVLDGSATTAILAGFFLDKHPGSIVIHNAIVSDAVRNLISDAGGVPTVSRVGHSHMKAKMRESGAVFGGEHSGHFYFRDFYGADTGFMTLLTMARIVGAGTQPLSEMRERVSTRFSSGEINHKVDDPATIMGEMIRKFPDAEIDRTDGLTLRWEDRRVNVRNSNTESVLRLNVEADDEETLGSLVTEMGELIKQGRNA